MESSTAIHIPLSRQTEMPWKNGGGTTREIRRHDDAAGTVWRASIATIHQSGPFSLFPGCDRIITLIQGPPVMLDFADGEHMTLTMFAPQHFSCDRPLSASIAGTSHDLNLIWRRDAVSVEHSVQTVRGKTAITLPPAQWHILVVCSGTMAIDAGGQVESLATGEALLFDRTTEPRPVAMTLASEHGVALAFSIMETD